ncbi:MAG: patatin-like phospholipase family protein [Myxococcales bacterium]|nr:patatin-like phospholipase family protein [Myxococcales bacterium]
MSASPYDLVLSSGFLAFASHAGFLAAVEEADLAVDGICGTSSGALTGALWAAGMPAREILTLLTERPPLAWLVPHLSPWRGLFRLDRMVEELEERLPADFAGLQRSFGAGVVTRERQPVLLTSGSLPLAVAASCAVPYLFAPVVHGDVPYQDGGVADRLFLEPWRALRPQARPVVHLVERSSGAAVQTDLSALPVVRSPRSGAQLWSLGPAQERFERTRTATLQLLARTDLG